MSDTEITKNPLNHPDIDPTLTAILEFFSDRVESISFVIQLDEIRTKITLREPLAVAPCGCVSAQPQQSS